MKFGMSRAMHLESETTQTKLSEIDLSQMAA
jgi:hypothetical protein